MILIEPKQIILTKEVVYYHSEHIYLNLKKPWLSLMIYARTFYRTNKINDSIIVVLFVSERYYICLHAIRPGVLDLGHLSYNEGACEESHTDYQAGMHLNHFPDEKVGPVLDWNRKSYLPIHNWQGTTKTMTHAYLTMPLAYYIILCPIRTLTTRGWCE